MRRFLRADLLAHGDHVLCACSGGADSTAMLHALALLRARHGLRLSAVGVDHGLRPEAQGELSGVERTAHAHAVPFVVRAVEVGAGSNLQARAREARYAALADEARSVGAACVAVGHTADDRAETVVMRLLGGAGPRGLGVMPPRSSWPLPGVDGAPALVRPLLRARRSDVLAHLERHALGWSEDPSNRDRRFLRARVRAEVMPLLESLSPSVVEHLCALAEALEAPEADPLATLPRAQRQAVARLLGAREGRLLVRLRGDRDLRLEVQRVGRR